VTIGSRSLVVVLLAVALAPFFVKLGASSIWDANEAFYAETPREMIESGDYINPAFNYEPRFNKPVLSYWIVAGLYQVFGVSVAVERLAITGMAMIMVMAAWFIARAVSTQPLAPLLAALGLAAGPRFFMFSRRIMVDMAVTAMMTLTLLFFVLAERYPERRRLFLGLMYVSVGLGVLTKGPVAAVIPFLVFVTYLAVHRELARLREMMIPLGTVIAVAIVVPWYAALYAQHGWTYIRDFFIGENFGRFTGTEDFGPQSRGLDFYLPVLISDALPWSLCLPAIGTTWWRERRSAPPSIESRLRTLLLLWIAVIVVFFSFSQTKQDLYIFPVVAAIAALGGDWVARALRGAFEPWFRATLTVLGAAMVGLGVGVMLIFGGAGASYVTDGAHSSALIAILGGLAAALAPWWRRYHLAVAAVLAVLVSFNWILATRALPAFERYKPVVPLAEVIASRAGPDDVVAHLDVALPSMVFYLRRHIDVGFDAGTFAELMKSDRRVFGVLNASRYEELKGTFGVETCVLGRHATADIRLRTLLHRQAPPEVLVITNRCEVADPRKPRLH
jgi:4-amino-4-deoxy-L-arabinose transferase-like glycosyltransferase